MLTFSAVFYSENSFCEILTLDEGANEKDREGGGAAGLRGPRQEGDDENVNDDSDQNDDVEGIPPLHCQPGDWDPVLRQGMGHYSSRNLDFASK